MPKYSNNDHYLDAATGVLKNRLGITSQITLEKIEADLASIRSYELAINPLHGSFDLAHLQALHYYLFQDVYEWAGQLRDIDISKGSSFFAHHTHIVTAAKPIFTKLAADKNLTGLSKELFSNKAAHYLGEINALHPFREGNGRVQREFISHLAYNNGFSIEWKNIDPQELLQAAIESFKTGDCSKFTEHIHVNLKTLNMETECHLSRENPHEQPQQPEIEPDDDMKR